MAKLGVHWIGVGWVGEEIVRYEELVVCFLCVDVEVVFMVDFSEILVVEHFEHEVEVFIKFGFLLF